MEVDTEEMRKWRGLSQREMDQCWKNFVEKMEEAVLNKYKGEESKKEAFEGRGAPLDWRGVRKNKKYRRKKVMRRLLGKNFLFVQRIQLPASAKQAGGVNGRGRDEAAAKNDDYERSDEENQIKRKKGR